MLGLFLPKHELYDRERHIKFGGHLGGFGADMLEAEINKLKEKNRTLCLPSRSLTINQVIIQTRINVSQGKPTDLRLNWPRIWTNVKKEGWPSPVFGREAWILLTCPICLNVLPNTNRFQGKRFWSRTNTEILDQETTKSNSHILHTMMAWSGLSDPEKSWKDRARLYLHVFIPPSIVLTILTDSGEI